MEGLTLKRLLGKSSNGHITGVDYSEVSVQKSKKLNRAAIQEGRCEVLQGNVMNLPFSENTFHLVTAFETIYFWPGIQVAFQQVYRVLKNGGTFLICNESNGKNTKDEKWTDIIHGMTIYTSEQIEKELGKCWVFKNRGRPKPKRLALFAFVKKMIKKVRQHTYNAVAPFILLQTYSRYRRRFSHSLAG